MHNGMKKKNQTGHRNIETYSFLWDKSQPSWHLLQRRERSQSGDPLYWPFNVDNPTQMVPEAAFYLGIIENMLTHQVPIISFEQQLTDPLQDYCWKAGYSYPVITGTFTYLLPQWEATVAAIIAGELPDFYEYLNDMDGRKILDQLLTGPHGHVPEDVQQRI
jgi:hypothetical protein